MKNITQIVKESQMEMKSNPKAVGPKPRKGLRVRFVGNAAAVAVFYRNDAPSVGEEGSVTDLPVPGGRKTYMPGPRGGLVYVNWDNIGTVGVFRADVEKV